MVEMALKQLDGKDLQILPNNVTEGDPDPDPEPEPEPEVCLDETWKIYTYVSDDEKKIVNSDTRWCRWSSSSVRRKCLETWCKRGN